MIPNDNVDKTWYSLFFCIRTASTVLFNWLVEWNSGGPQSDPGNHWELPSFTKGLLSLWPSSTAPRLYQVPLTKTLQQLQIVKMMPQNVAALLMDLCLTPMMTKHKVRHQHKDLFLFITFWNSNVKLNQWKIYWTGQITPESPRIGQCRALYNFTPEQDDELTLKEGKTQVQVI